MKTYFLRAILSLLSLFPAITLSAKDEYTFDLNNPPPYAKEWFAIAKRFQAIQEAGAVEGYEDDGAYRLSRSLFPKPNSSPEMWAAHRFAENIASDCWLPNFKYLNPLKTQAKDADDIRGKLEPWSYGDFIAHIGNRGSVWALYPPSVSPQTPPEEVRRLKRYIVRLNAKTVKRLADEYQPDYKKRYWHKTTFDRSREPGAKPLTPEENETLRIAWREEAWNDAMIRIHENYRNSLRLAKSSLCCLFRAYLPGDKESIREMLIEAGFKTVEDRKAYWQFCRTLGANWADWKPEDEQRLVTD